MNAISILRHAYMTISNSHPEKDAFAVVSDIEALVKRLVDAAKFLDGAVVSKAEAPAAVPATPAPVAPVTPTAATTPVPDTLYPLPPLPTAQS